MRHLVARDKIEPIRLLYVCQYPIKEGRVRCQNDEMDIFRHGREATFRNPDGIFLISIRRETVIDCSPGAYEIDMQQRH